MKIRLTEVVGWLLVWSRLSEMICDLLEAFGCRIAATIQLDETRAPY